MNKQQLKNVLLTWKSMNGRLVGFSLKDLDKLISLELNGLRRRSYLERLLMRRNKLVAREYTKQFFKTNSIK